MAKKTVEEINLAQQRASVKAIKLNKALGLSYYVVEKDKLYEITPDGKKHFIKKARFGTVNVGQKHIKLANGN